MNKQVRRKIRRGKIKEIAMWIGIILWIAFCLGGVIYSGIMQCILSYEKFGVIFNTGDFIIADKSLWWNLTALGFIPMMFLIA